MQTQETFSHPEAEVRHSYPLAIQSASFSTAFELVHKTLPYALARFGILVGITLAAVVWLTALIGGYVWLAQSAVPLLAYPWFLGLAFAGGWAWFVVGRYFLYLLKAGHIAVLTELVTTGGIGSGDQSMFEYGKSTVQERFTEVNVLFGVDLLIDGVVRAFNRTLHWVADLIPVPGLSSLTGVVTAVVHASSTYIDETLLSYNLARRDENVWRSSRDGLVYYAQNAQEVLKTGVWIVVIDKVLTAVAWLVCLAPAFAVAFVLPSSVTLGGVLPVGIAVLFAANVRSAFLKPLFLTMVMVKFHHCVQNQAIHREWDARLDSVSDKFREIKRKADDLGNPGSMRPPAGAAPHSV